MALFGVGLLMCLRRSPSRSKSRIVAFSVKLSVKFINCIFHSIWRLVVADAAEFWEMLLRPFGANVDCVMIPNMRAVNSAIPMAFVVPLDVIDVIPCDHPSYGRDYFRLSPHIRHERLKLRATVRCFAGVDFCDLGAFGMPRIGRTRIEGIFAPAMGDGV